tara:strand:- start:2291 stop:2716 length:426 start_codon:yes stop_codon:yes gene_type:complete
MRLEGLNKLEKKLGRLATARLLLPALDKGAKLIYQEAAKYPPQPKPRGGGKPYRRTGLFGESFSARSYQRQRDLYSVVKNTAARKGRLYGIYVMGPKTGSKGKRQAWMHKGVWPTLQYVADKNAGEVAGLMQAKIDRILKG